jgi:hypothetical protein
VDKFRNKRYRDGYVAAHTREVLAKQMREFRGDQSQSAFAQEMGKRQTVISRLENPSYIGWTLSTMFEIARKRNVAVFVRFVDFPTFLKLSEDMSDSALHPKSYDEDHMENRVKEESKPIIVDPLPAQDESFMVDISLEVDASNTMKVNVSPQREVGGAIHYVQ